MWSSKSINIFIWFCCTTSVRAEYICDFFYILPNWDSKWSERPGNVSLGEPREVAVGLEVQIFGIRENFNLTLLANPFIKNEGDCRPARSLSTSYLNLRKFHMSYPVTGDGNESKSLFFSKIFTGCYYVEMTNAEGIKWLWDPVFVNTSYHYHDTMLNCSKHEVRPENYEQSRQLKYKLEIPLTCCKVRCLILETDKAINNTKQLDLDDKHIRATQACWITNEGNRLGLHVKCERTDTRLILDATTADEKGEGWETLITWDHLKIGGAFYYTSFELHNHTCDMSYNDLMTWEPVVKFGTSAHGFRNESNMIRERERISFIHSVIASIPYILLGAIVAAILIYWMTKCAKILIKQKYRLNNVSVHTQLHTQLHDQKEFNHILLIYARDLPPFMRAMEAFRERLQQTCHFPVHDLFSINEWNMIVQFGATEWVENLLRAGSKVVWVDTPQFRSVLRDSRLDEEDKDQYIASDFRDEAIPYAVALATNLFQNVTTQYRCHFVVRIEGFQVEDGDDDPLLVVSPHARYSIPEHLPLLCEHLAR